MALLLNRNSRIGVLSYCQEINYNGGARHTNLLLRDRLAGAKNLFRKDQEGHFGCVNAIEFSSSGGELIASGGDDRRVLIWNTEKCIASRCLPESMTGQHHSNIFCLAFDSSNRRIFSGGNDEQVVYHDIETKQTVDVFLHEEAVYGLAVDPVNDNVFVSACDDGKVLLYDTRSSPSEDPFCIANCRSPMHSVTYNPMEPRLIATANAREGLALWDVRRPKIPLLRYGGKNYAKSSMSVKISRTGKTLIALRRKLPPVMYNLHDTNAVCEFDNDGYLNSCTMKSCCFAGDKDQYLVSGSDDFNLYFWKLPEPGRKVKWVSEADLVLRGHRSIANQVRFNPVNHMLISSGVEKIIKIWSLFPMPYCQGDLGDGDFDYSERPVYTHEEYINLVLRSGQVMSHDYTNQSTKEDPRMMAFFDSLVQREMEGNSTDDSTHDSDDGANYQPFVVDSSDGSNSDTLSNHSGDEDGSLSPFTMAFAVAMARRARQPREDEDEGGGGGGDTDRPEDILDVRNSFMQRLDELDNDGHEDGEDNGGALPGQRPNPGRRSIGELIDLKRKEYLMKAKNQSERKKSNTASERDVSDSSSSDSLSSSSSCESDSEDRKAKNIKKTLSKIKKRRKENGILNTDIASCSRHDSTEVMKELATERENVKSRMQRIKGIRNRAMNSMSDSTGSCAISSQSEETNGVTISNNTDKNKLSRNGIENECNKIAPTSTADNSKTDNRSLTQLNERNGNQPNFALNTSKDNEQSRKVRTYTAASDNEASSSVANSINSHNASSAQANLKEHSSNMNGHDNDNGAGTSNGASAGTCTESQPVWTQFKKFRNRVEKAHRQYRKASANLENSTCSSGEES